MRALLLFLPIALLPACQSAGVVQVSPGNYMISRQSAAGMFVNMSKLKSDVIQEANNFAQQQGGVAIQTGMEVHQPLAMGLPSVTYNFSVMSQEKFNKIAARSERDWASLSSSERVAIQEAGLDRSTYAQQQSLNRQAYNARSATMALPQRVQHDVNLSGDVRQTVDVNGTIYLRR